MIDLRELFNCESFTKISNAIVEVLPYHGASRSRFFLCKYDGIEFLLKIGIYSKSLLEIYNPSDSNHDGYYYPPLAEAKILEILKTEFVDTGATPCILECIFSKECHEISKHVPSIEKCNNLLMYYDNIPGSSLDHLLCMNYFYMKTGLGVDSCIFLVLERCDITLSAFLDKGIKTTLELEFFKSLLFQIIYTFNIITQKYPKFRHHDLHLGNIMLKNEEYALDLSNLQYLLFVNNDKKYYVPYFGIIPKIIDFDYAELPEKSIHSNITEQVTSMYWRPDNDIIKLLQWIYSTLSTNTYILSLLKTLEPNETYIKTFYGYIEKIADKLPTTDDMMKSSVFKKYQKKPKGKIYKTYKFTNQ